jgi:hypothetical protein
MGIQQRALVSSPLSGWVGCFWRGSPAKKRPTPLLFEMIRALPFLNSSPLFDGVIPKFSSYTTIAKNF